MTRTKLSDKYKINILQKLVAQVNTTIMKGIKEADFDKPRKSQRPANDEIVISRERLLGLL